MAPSYSTLASSSSRFKGALLHGMFIRKHSWVRGEQQKPWTDEGGCDPLFPGGSELVYDWWPFATHNFAGSSGGWQLPKRILALRANRQPICASFTFWWKFPNLVAGNENISLWTCGLTQADPPSTPDGGATCGCSSFPQNMYHYTVHDKNGLNRSNCTRPGTETRGGSWWGAQQ